MANFDHLAVRDDLNAVGGLLDDGARVAAHERIAPEVLAALDRLEQEGFPLPPDLLVGGQRRLEIREDAARDGDEIPCAASFRKSSSFGECMSWGEPS